MFIPGDASVRTSFTIVTGDMEFRYSAGSVNSNIHVNCEHVIVVTLDNHYIHAPRKYSKGHCISFHILKCITYKIHDKLNN